MLHAWPDKDYRSPGRGVCSIYKDDLQIKKDNMCMFQVDHMLYDLKTTTVCTQGRVQPDQCYFTVQITGSNFECSL